MVPLAQRRLERAGHADVVRAAQQRGPVLTRREQQTDQARPSRGEALRGSAGHVAALLDDPLDHRRRGRRDPAEVAVHHVGHGHHRDPGLDGDVLQRHTWHCGPSLALDAGSYRAFSVQRYSAKPSADFRPGATMMSFRTAAALGLVARCSPSASPPAAPRATQPDEGDGTVALQVAMDTGLDDDAIAAFDARIAQFEDAEPRHQRRARRVHLGRDDVRRRARGRHPARRVPRPVHRRPRPHRERADRRRQRRSSPSSPTPTSTTPTSPRPARTPTGTSGPSRSPPTARACTTTATCSPRPASTPTTRPRRGRRSARTPRRSPTPPARPGTPP